MKKKKSKVLIVLNATATVNLQLFHCSFSVEALVQVRAAHKGGGRRGRPS